MRRILSKQLLSLSPFLSLSPHSLKISSNERPERTDGPSRRRRRTDGSGGGAGKDSDTLLTERPTDASMPIKSQLTPFARAEYYSEGSRVHGTSSYACARKFNPSTAEMERVA